MLHLTEVKHKVIMSHVKCNLHFYNSATYGSCQAVFQGKSKDFSRDPKNRVTVPETNCRSCISKENAASERTVNVAGVLSMCEDNDQNIFGGRWEQGGSGEETDRYQMPGRTGGMKEKGCNQTTEGLYGAGTAACGNCPLPAGIVKAGSAAYRTDLLQAARLWCFGMACSQLINGFVSLIRLSDRNLYHLEDD